jgi:hypothetical protein
LQWQQQGAAQRDFSVFQLAESMLQYLQVSATITVAMQGWWGSAAAAALLPIATLSSLLIFTCFLVSRCRQGGAEHVQGCPGH